MYKITASNNKYTFIAKVEAEDEISALEQVLDDTENFPHALYGTEDLEIELLPEPPKGKTKFEKPKFLDTLKKTVTTLITTICLSLTVPAYSETYEFLPISQTIDVICTAYSLAYEECNKTPNDPYYGITANGTNLRNKTREEALAIAVDPSVIPLGSYVQLIAKDEEMSKYNGIYYACDVGGAINGNRIDIFFGEDLPNIHEEMAEFGKKEFTANVLAFLPDKPDEPNNQFNILPDEYSKEKAWASALQFDLKLNKK